MTDFIVLFIEFLIIGGVLAYFYIGISGKDKK